MILSASRRTDIPAFYLDWFLKRLEEGYAYVRNHRRPHQVSRIALNRETIDCIVFWSKNPGPMLGALDRLAAYPYYVQFSINPYGGEWERNLPPLQGRLTTFRRMAEAIGPERMVWRYSPVFLDKKHTEAYHMDVFSSIATALEGSTRRCNVSFIEVYDKIRPRLAARAVGELEEEQKNRMARAFFLIAEQRGIALSACGNMDSTAAGVPAAGCIDGELIARITGKHFALRKDPGQPADCRCVRSVDIGSYNTCLNGCLYCYANTPRALSTQCKAANYDEASPMLCDELRPGDLLRERVVKAEGTGQMRLF